MNKRVAPEGVTQLLGAKNLHDRYSVRPGQGAQLMPASLGRIDSLQKQRGRPGASPGAKRQRRRIETARRLSTATREAEQIQAMTAQQPLYLLRQVRGYPHGRLCRPGEQVAGAGAGHHIAPWR